VRVKQSALRPDMAGAMQGKDSKRGLLKLVTMAPMHRWLAAC